MSPTPHTTPDWDARSYDRISEMQLVSGRDFLARVPLRGDEVVLDAGCGTGRVTRLISERVPRGRVIGVDASPSMIAQARENLGPEVELVLSDLLELELREPVDLVFSTAAIHWIGDHERLFGAIHGWLRPGGRLAAQFGSRGNARDVVEAAVNASRHEPFAGHLCGFERPWNFPSPEETAPRLERAGSRTCAVSSRSAGTSSTTRASFSARSGSRSIWIGSRPSSTRSS